MSIDSIDASGVKGRKRKLVATAEKSLDVKNVVGDARRAKSGSRDTSPEPSAAGATQARKRRKLNKSAGYTHQALEALDNGSFVVDPAKWDKFTPKIRQLDKYATLDKDDPRTVRHSICGQYIKLSEPYNIRNFKNHCERKTCAQKTGKAALPGRGMQLLTAYTGFTRTKGLAPSTPAPPPTPKPVAIQTSSCRGLQDDDFPGVARYIHRTGYSGGGSLSLSHYARSMFGLEYRELSKKQKHKVAAKSYQDQQWRIAHIDQAVFSTSCLHNVQHPITTENPPCKNCLHLMDNKDFRKAVRRRVALPENLKYVNSRFLNVSSGLLYAGVKGVAELLQGDVSNFSNTFSILFAEANIIFWSENTGAQILKCYSH